LRAKLPTGHAGNPRQYWLKKSSEEMLKYRQTPYKLPTAPILCDVGLPPLVGWD
jgi:hypothetical protein